MCFCLFFVVRFPTVLSLICEFDFLLEFDWVNNGYGTLESYG